MSEINLIPTDYYNNGCMTPIKKSSQHQRRTEKLQSYIVESNGEQIGIIREYEKTVHSDRILFKQYWQPLTLERRRIKGLDGDGTRQGAVDALVMVYDKNSPKSA